MDNQKQRIERDPRMWILPLKRHESPASRLKRQVAKIIDVIPSRLYLTLGEFRRIQWTQDPAKLERVLNVIRQDKAAGKLEKVRDMLSEDRPYEDRHLLMLYEFLMDAYHRADWGTDEA